MPAIKKQNTNDQIPTTNDQLPQHIAFIMDGNRRWAAARGKPGLYGHKVGADVAAKVAEYLIKRGVGTVSFYVFSIENWGRDAAEVDFLMKFIQSEMPKLAARAAKNNIRMKFIGRRDHLAPKILKLCDKFEKDTAENTAGTLAFALDFGGQDEIVRAANDAIEYYRNNPTNDQRLTTADFESFMDTGELLPVDLMVRTSGEQRISNFMLWKLAYAELMFIPEHWPEVDEKILERILGDYAKRQRRFGK
ncbi:MAG: polyprenyl diphosphate synthase [Proteobacteria bacterium]|nr:polyprenyl diphosphate synthase [Pseudomonadota bacterium]